MNFDSCAMALLSHSYSFAKSMPQHPHWYTLRKDWNDDGLFNMVVNFIREHCYTEYFKGRAYQMFNLNEYKYWTMGAPIKDTILINRAVTESHNTYDQIADQYQDLFQDEASEQENREVIRMIDLKGRVLDIGCGSGLLLDYVRISKDSYLGIDPSARMLQYFNKKNQGYEVINCAFESFYSQEGFDTVVSLFGSPSYILPTALHRIKKLLRPGGTAFLMFYKNDYVPVTYKQTGITVEHFRNDMPGEFYHNYKIVRL